MAVSRDITSHMDERIRNSPEIRLGLLSEVFGAIAVNDLSTAKAVMRSYIRATVGFEELGRSIGTDPKNLMRMFSIKGNPQLKTLAPVLEELLRRENAEVEVKHRATG